MNTPASQTPEDHSDAALNELLRSWKVKIDLGSNFRAAVWQRIATASEASLAAKLLRWLESHIWVLARPAVAAALIALTTFVGVWFGSADSHSPTASKSAYVRSISPFAGLHTEQQ